VIASAQSVIEQIEARLDGADIITTLRGSYKAVIIGSGRATVIHPSGQAEKDK